MGSQPLLLLWKGHIQEFILNQCHLSKWKAEVLVAQLCPTVCDPMDCSPPGSTVHGILQARILERIAMPSSRGSSGPRDWTWISWISCIGRWVLFQQHDLRCKPLKLSYWILGPSSLSFTDKCSINVCRLRSIAIKNIILSHLKVRFL